MTWNWTTDTTMGTMMDTEDYNPDILEREAVARERVSTRQQTDIPSSSLPPKENPQVTAINQMQIEAYWREVTLRANLIAQMRAKESGRA